MSTPSSTNEQHLLAASVLAQMGSAPVRRSSKAATNRKRRKTTKQPEPEYPVPVIQTIHKPKTFVNHTYRDFSAVPATDTTASLDDKSIEAMTFGEKVFHMLSQSEYERWITWNPHGRSFHILVPKRLEQSQCLQKYFGHSRYSSFLRQLANYGFKHVTKGQDRNSYYHECFLQGLPHLLKYMPAAKDVRRQVPDPENEPDFYALAQKNPLKSATLNTSSVAKPAPRAPPCPPPVRTTAAASLPTLKRPASVALHPPQLQSRVVERPTVLLPQNKVPRVMIPQNLLGLAQQLQKQQQAQQLQKQPMPRVSVVAQPLAVPAQRLLPPQPRIDVAQARARLVRLQQEQDLLTAWLHTQQQR